MTARLMVVGTGAVTSVGLTADQTCAAFRARISGFSDVYAAPPDFDAVPGAVVPAHDFLRSTPQRWIENLLVRAVRQCLEQMPSRGSRVALSLCLPLSPHPSVHESAGADWIARIQERLGARFDPASEAVGAGHAGGLRAIASAHDLLMRDVVDYVVVAGVDSMVVPEVIERLASTQRLHGERNPQGVIPGEGAAAVLLTLRSEASPENASMELCGVGVADEVNPIDSGRTSTGVGLATAIRRATEAAGIAEPAIRFRVSDVNGERYSGLESMLAEARFYRTHREVFPVWHPAMSVGDIGAATGPLLLTVAATGFRRGYAPGEIGVCEAASDDGLRAACVIRSAPEGK